jgi:hypothetical protein
MTKKLGGLSGVCISYISTYLDDATAEVKIRNNRKKKETLT